MSVFKKDKKEDKGDDTPELDIPPVSTGGGGDSPGKDLNPVRAATAKKRGRPPGASNKSKSASVQNTLDESLFEGHAWEAVAAAPFNFRRVMTGSDIFKLEPEQKQVLGSSLGAVMKALNVIDPKYIALTIFASNLASVFAQKEVEYAIEKAKKKKAKTDPKQDAI